VVSETPQRDRDSGQEQKQERDMDKSSLEPVEKKVSGEEGEAGCVLSTAPQTLETSQVPETPKIHKFILASGCQRKDGRVCQR
jgi:hypothetical protein